MAGHTLFIRASGTRKPQFQLITLIKESGGGLVVSKSAANTAAIPHMLSFAAKRDTLLRAGADCAVAKILEKSQNEITFAYIKGLSLENKLLRALNDNDEKAVKTVIDQAFAVIDSLASAKTNPAENKAYREVFGEYYAEACDCITPGCVDFNLDNLIESNGKLTLIDYEWVFDFPVPKDFVKLRLLHHAFLEARTNLLKSQPDREIVIFNDSLFLPKNIFNLYKDLFSKVDAYLLSNLHFLNYLQIPQADLKKDLYRRTVSAEEALEALTQYSAGQPRLQKDLAAANGQIASLEETVRQQQAILEAKQGRIERLEHTLSYKFLQRAEIRLRKKIRDIIT